jgi:hypothetical protein
MERVLDIYHLPYNPDIPVVAMDEQPVQFFKETRLSIPATRYHPKRVDYEYERAGVVNIFMFTAPLCGWRRASVREKKTKVDWAYEIRDFLEVDFPNAEKVILVCDNLNTPTAGAFYEAIEPEVARALVKRLEFCYTPKHGSWLNVAENELSALPRQCVSKQRFETIEKLRDETNSWTENCNKKQKSIIWQFNVENARIKLHALYPKS